VERLRPRDFIARRTVGGAGKELDVGGKHALPIGKRDRRRIEAFMRSFAERQAWPAYFAVLDVARRVAGTGSLGIERYTILVRGGGALSTRFVLDLKAAVASALEPYVDARQPRWESEADRVVEVQRRVQAIAPALLQAVSIEGKPFVLRELMPTQDKIDFTKIAASQEELDVLARDAGLIVGWSELRSGGRDGSATIDELQAFSQRRKWRSSLLDYATQYAAVVRRDWRTFREAYLDDAV
jgi:uncharacterized protein (DUF2252 family)